MTLGFAVVAWVSATPVGCAAESPRPNIVLILADDLGYGDVGCFGQARIQTPHLDRMAAEGMRFTQVYAGSTVCAPSRGVLMTGRHVGHATVRGNAGTGNPLSQALRAGDTTVADVLKQAGYATALIGKWGLGDAGDAQVGLPRRHGFEYFYGYLSQHHAHNYYPEFLWRNEEKVKLANVVTNADERGAGVANVRREYAPDLFAAEALKFIRENRSRPFFLYFATTIPHANNEAKRQGMEVPDLGGYRTLDWPEPQKGHAAMITRLDRDVGRLLSLLQELGLEQNTFVLFTSDNGPHKEGGVDPAFNRSSGPLRGIKRDHYEGGIRVPTILRWPAKVPQGSVNDAIWYFADVMPTLAELAGTVAPAGIDGVSIVPTLLGKGQSELKDRFLYWEFHENGFKQAARHGDWKAVRNHLDDPIELYDLSRDIGETRNVAVQQPQVVSRFEDYFKTARVDSPDWPVKMSPRAQPTGPP